MSAQPFPANVVEVFRTYLPNLLDTSLGDQIEGVTFVGRPLILSDPNPTVGAYPSDWMPLDHEIGQFSPAVGRYMLVVQLLSSGYDEESARETHGVLGTALRLNLYQNESIKAALLALTHEALGFKERLTHYGVQRHRYFNAETEAGFTFLTNIDFWVNVEQVPI